jgi:hypothetical protein
MAAKRARAFFAAGATFASFGAASYGAAFFGAAVLAAQKAVAQETQISAPLSAIDWLSDSVTPAPNGSTANTPPSASEAPVTGGIAPAQPIATTVLGGPSLDAVGLLPPAKTGFPAALWGNTRAHDVASAITAIQVDGIPALQELAVKLLLAEAAPPAMDDPAQKGTVLLARIDKLLAMGALDQAFALIEAAGPALDANLFRRAFDVSLLMGEEDRACTAMRATRGLKIAPQTRAFCAARAGDWAGAALILSTESALGGIPELEAELLGRFLDPEAFDDPNLPPPPKPVTPLIWRIYDALGETLPTGMLPIAFAHGELGPRAGWKSQAEAAERLARAGVLSPNQLLGIYTAQKPAASGGVWDRIRAFQKFDTAISAADVGAVATTLPPAYAAMKAVELEVPFAAIYAEALAKMPLTGTAGDMAFELGLLSPLYEVIAQADGKADGQAPARMFLAGLAQGDITARAPFGNMGRAVAAGFGQPPLPPDLAGLVQTGNVGMATLAAIARIHTGVLGEDRAISEGIALLRALGLEAAARRTALELMILERRG